MKSSKIFLLLFIIIFGAGEVFAQNRETEKQQPTVPQVQKGYYSIGNNAQKLNGDQQVITPVTGTDAPRKGFFSLKPNARKLSTRSVRLQTGGTPVVTKGYYAIGNNAEKLK
ncbi:hypothetical protein EXU57_02775 [Segetibacter sp. 3557_3]|uniref:hypothetical protein n=1 Tax=Segetibacter sp. 3557_3 TaxID=2547429 RepID=UPI0010587577|nr:hypothetical protein [Segetibacter sp. 3557_3]TDH29015.1 hypothetical protein EXU57_02775 [Segetibacter sp. 3557_3]